MVQTIAGTTRNPWILHMRKCAIHYREEQAAKAKASSRDEAPKPKRRLTKKTSPEEAADKASSKDEAPKPRRRLTKKTSPEEALAAAAAPPPPPVVAVQRRRILKTMSEAAAALADIHASTRAPPEAPPAKPVRRRLTAKTTPDKPKTRLTKKTPTIYSRWQSPP